MQLLSIMWKQKFLMAGAKFEPSILSGQSFRYLNSQKEWEDGADLVLSTKTRDIYGITYRIKAHTKTLDSPAKMQISNTSLSMYAGEKKSLSASATRNGDDNVRNQLGEFGYEYCHSQQ